MMIDPSQNKLSLPKLTSAEPQDWEATTVTIDNNFVGLESIVNEFPRFIAS